MKTKLIFFILLAPIFLLAQVLNDECKFAQDLGSITNYCSGVDEFSNTEATFSGVAVPMCWFGGSANDMWYTLSPTAPAMYIQMIGATLDNPSIAIYQGNCSNLVEVACASKETDNLIELSINNMVIGGIYYLRVDARDSNVGTFQLCMESFIPKPMPESDCKDAVVLCDKSPFQVENLNNVGDIDDELTGSCIESNQEGESASVWYTWTCDQAGTLTFTLDPNNPNSEEEDLDFVVYEMPGGLDDCENRFSLRCMLSGESQQNTPAQNAPCYGPTGLAEGETDTEEFAGCNNGSNNFLAPIDMESGKSYGLIVNNYSESGYGFSIEFGGTGTFLGPNPDFEIEDIGVLECDKLNNFLNLSTSETDQIIDYNWNFGAGANPISTNGPGPHEVEFNSFGDKVAALTVETSRGCTVTKILEFYVEPCCQDTTNLNVTADATDVECFGDDNGEIIADGQAGDPRYEYSIDGINYQLNPRFANLPVDDYTIYIVDIKGCRDSIMVSINAPGATTVDAGPDIELDLGESDEVNATVDTEYEIVDISWSPLDTFLSCINCLDPEILPPGTTTYTITVTDSNGCIATDEMQFIVNIVRPTYFPTIFSPNNDGRNEFFNLFGGPAVKRIKSLKVFDRWGNLVYEGSPTLNEPGEGWNGQFNGIDVLSGVYTWMGQLEFVDKLTITYTGTITLVR